MRASPFWTPILLGLTVVALSACDKRISYGDADSIILGSSPDLWSEIEDTTYTILEPSIQTVRQETTFQVTYHNPGDTLWTTLRRWRQMLVIGAADDPWVAEAIEESGRDASELTSPMVFQVDDVWALNQLVTVALLSDTEAVDEALELMPEINELLDGQFREFARARMFVSGADTALARELAETTGFTLTIPTVYNWSTMDSVYRFRNDNPSPSELIREVAVTWRSIDSEAEDPLAIDPEYVADWRREIVAGYYSEGQVTEIDEAPLGRFQLGSDTIYQLQATWAAPPENLFPAGGPFIARIIPCRSQDRVYLLDAWLYAPGRAKYEYMIQLETILNSFECV